MISDALCISLEDLVAMCCLVGNPFGISPSNAGSGFCQLTLRNEDELMGPVVQRMEENRVLQQDLLSYPEMGTDLRRGQSQVLC